jgi:hypothetical protein
MLHNQIHTACSCPCCMFMSMLHSMSMWMSTDIYIEMPKCRTVRHPVSLVPDWKKLTMLKPVQYRTKLTQSSIFLVRYRTKIRDARMPMPALVSSMLMPSYGLRKPFIWEKGVVECCVRKVFLRLGIIATPTRGGDVLETTQLLGVPG